MATSASPDPTGLEKTTGLSDAKKSFPSLDSLDTAMNQMQFAAAEPAAIGTTHGAAVRISTAGIEISMGSVGDCYDNAVCETFHATLKKEKIYRQSWPTRAEARTADLRVHRGLVQPAPPALDARLSVPDRVRATPRRARPTGARSLDFGQRIGRVDLAERLRRAYNASHLDGRRRFRCRPLDLSRERPRPPNRSRSGRDGRWSRDERQRAGLSAR